MAGGQELDGVGAGVVAGPGELGARVAEADRQQVGGRARPGPAEQLALLGGQLRQPGGAFAGSARPLRPPRPSSPSATSSSATAARVIDASTTSSSGLDLGRHTPRAAQVADADAVADGQLGDVDLDVRRDVGRDRR